MEASSVRRADLLHLLATSNSITALNAVQHLLRTKQRRATEPDVDGLTPLHVAAACGNVAMCQVFIFYGADPFAEDFFGRTPKDMATGDAKRFLVRVLNPRRRHDGASRFARVLRSLFSCAVPCIRCKKLPSSVKGDADGAFGIRRPSSACRLNDLATQIAIQELHPLLAFPNAESFNSAAPHSFCGAEAMKCGAGECGISQDIGNVYSGGKATEGREMSPSRSVSPKGISSSPSNISSPSPVSSPSNVSSPSDRSEKSFKTALSGSEESSDGKFFEAKATFDESSPVKRSQHPKISVTRNSWMTETSQDERGDEEEIPDSFMQLVSLMGDLQLKDELCSRGQTVGPITESTRCVYVKRLARILVQNDLSSAVGKEHFSPALEKLMIDSRITERAQKLDEAVIADYEASSKLRAGSRATSFCYLLLDPSLISDHRNCELRKFVRAIFYVGKGKRSRPLQHLKDALQARNDHSESLQSGKLRRIHEIWDKGLGVVSLHVFQNTVPAEALTREASMIEAIGLNNLTNMKRGDYFGCARMWSTHEKTLYGAYLLRKALDIFHVEGCRQLFEMDVRATTT